MVFEAEAVLPITPLNLAVKRGRLGNLAIEMGDYQVTQVAGMFGGLLSEWTRMGKKRLQPNIKLKDIFPFLNREN